MLNSLAQRIGSFGPAGSSLFGMLLRGLLLCGKFVFTIILARETSATIVGVYALSVAVSTIFVYLVGVELHTYATRESIASDGVAERSRHFQNHIVFVFALCALSLPLAWGTLRWLHLSQSFSFALFAMMLFGEILCQELGRYLIVLSMPVASNTLQLLRGAGWMPVAIWMLSYTSLSPINIVLGSWCGGCVAAVLFGLWRLRDNLSSRAAISLTWLRGAFASSRFYFIVALLTQIQGYADRIVVQQYLGERRVGQLAFFQSFANTVQGFVLAGVISILLPDLLRKVRSGDEAGARTVCAKMTRNALLVGVLVSASLLIAIVPLLRFAGREEYRSALSLFPWMLLGNIFVILGQVPHYQLYAQRRDRTLMWVALVFAPVAILANVLAVSQLGLAGSVAVFVSIMLLQTATKTFIARRAWSNSS